MRRSGRGGGTPPHSSVRPGARHHRPGASRPRPRGAAAARPRPGPGPRPDPGRVLRAAAGRLADAAAALLPCPACGLGPAGREGWCASCAARLGSPGGASGRLWLGPYAGSLGACARALKYRGATRLATPLGRALAKEVERRRWTVSTVVPVPSHATRRRERGLDHTALLASAVARALGVPMRTPLHRTRATPPQAGLDRAARQANVAGAVRADPVPGWSILLVDDVLTTGATEAACHAALRAAGAASVRTAVVARAEADRVGRGPSRA